MSKSKKDFMVKSTAIIDDMVRTGFTKEARVLLAVAAAVDTDSADALKAGQEKHTLASSIVNRIKKREG